MNLTSQPDRHYWRRWCSVCMLGLLNNVPYFVVLSSAYSLASSFSALSDIGLVQWAAVALSIACKLLNGLFLLHTPHTTRELLSCTMGGLGLSLLAVSPYTGFGTAILGIALLGGYGSLNESVVLGFMKRLSPQLISAWGTGSGGSGLLGALVYLLLHSVLGLQNRVIYFAMLPACLVFFLLFRSLETATLAQAAADKDELLVGPENSPSHAASVQCSPSVTPATSVVEAEALSLSPDVLDAAPADSGVPSRYAEAWRVGCEVRGFMLHLGAVYCLEYLIFVGLASQADPSADGSGWLYDNAYVLLSLCYQLGVLAARSSLPVLPFSRARLPVLTVLQAAFGVLWLAQAYWGLMPLPLQFVSMLAVGLVGGAAYVNTFYLLRVSILDQRDVELAVNLVAAAYNVGILMASLAELVLLHTVLTRQR
jgi:battenin